MKLKKKSSPLKLQSGHLEWRAGLSDTILKGTHPSLVAIGPVISEEKIKM
jgi:hypothetical protein